MCTFINGVIILSFCGINGMFSFPILESDRAQSLRISRSIMLRYKDYQMLNRFLTSGRGHTRDIDYCDILTALLIQYWCSLLA